jgi:hypothetical protein
MDMDMDKQRGHGHGQLTRHGHGPEHALGTNMQDGYGHGYAALTWTSSMDMVMQHGQEHAE